MSLSNLIEIGSVSQWNQTLRSATAEGRTIVVDFWATWCAPCKAISPYFSENLPKSFPQVQFLRVDVDAQQAIAAKYKITAMPTFIVIKAGKQVDFIKGADPNGLSRLVSHYAGPNPPIQPLPEGAEEARTAGNEHFRKGEFDQAVKKYSEAIAVVSDSAPLFANRSISYLKLTPPDTAAAVDDAKKATSVDPKWGKAWVRLGDALLAHGAPKGEVKAAYQKAVELLQDHGQRNEAESKLKNLGS